MSDYGYHWTPCNRGAGKTLVVVLLAVAAGVAYQARRAIITAVDIALITAVVLIAAALLGAGTYLVVRAHRQGRPVQSPRGGEVPVISVTARRGADAVTQAPRRAIQGERPVSATASPYTGGARERAPRRAR